MDEFDDDFGEIYADFELQPNSFAINGVSNFSYLQTIQEEEDDNNKVIIEDERENVKENDAVIGGIEKRENDSEISNNGGDKVELENDSESDEFEESDDDFDVVVNDEDVEAKSGGGDGRKCGKKAAEVAEVEDGDEVRKGSLMEKNRVRVDVDEVKQNGGGGAGGGGCGGERGGARKNGGKSPYKYIRGDGPVGNQRAICSLKADREDVWCVQPRISGFAPSFSGNGNSFWLPWYRTIVDVDIDKFEQKSWTHPQADITDYFNFGFDEESWRNYCRSLDVFRHQTLSQTRNQEYELGVFANAESMSIPAGSRNLSSNESDFAMRQFKKQIGQAIHVEDSNFERQSSADARRPRNLDSDVVIQITGQDSEEPSGSGKEELDNRPETRCDTSEKGLGHGNVEQDGKLGGSKSYKKGKVLEESPFRNPSLSSDCKRSGESASHMPLGSNGQGKDQSSDSDVHHSGKSDTVSEENPRVIQTHICSTENVDSGRDPTETDHCAAMIDLSFEDHEQSCLTPSSNAWSEESDDYSNLRRTPDLRRSSSVSTKERYHGAKVSHLCLRSKRDDKEVKESGAKYHVRAKISSKEGSRRSERSIQRHFKLKDYSDDNDDYPIGIAEHKYGVGRPRAHYHGRENFCLTSPRDDECWVQHRENKSSIACYDRRSVENWFQPEHVRDFDRQDHWGPKDEVDLLYPREWDEEKFFFGKKMQRVKGVTSQKDWHFQERGCVIRNEKPYFQNRQHFKLKHSSSHDINLFSERTEYDDVHFTKRSKKDQPSQLRYSGGSVHKRYGKPKPNHLDRQHKYLDSKIKHEEQLWHSGGKFETLGRGDEYFESSLDFDYPRYPVGDDEYWNRTTNHLNNQHREHESWLSPRREVGTLGRDGEYFDRILDVDYRRYASDDDEFWNDQTCASTHDYRDGFPTYGELRHHHTICRDHKDGPQLYQSYEKHTRSISSKKGVVDRQLCDHRDAYNRQGSPKYLDEDAYFENERIVVQSKGMSWTEDRLLSGGFDDDFFYENMLDSSKGIPRHKCIGFRHGTVPGGMYKHTKLRKGGFGVMNDGGAKKFSLMPTKVNHDENGLWDRNSVALRHTVRKRKTLQPTGKLSKAGTVSYNDARQHAVDFNWEQSKLHQKHDEACYGKTVEKKAQNNEATRGKLSVKNHGDAADLEEGQIPTEEPSTEILSVKKNGVGHLAQKDALKDSHVYDEKRILETMAKMEKRKERFKESVPVRKDMDCDPKPEVVKIVTTAGSKPVRKRKWG